MDWSQISVGALGALAGKWLFDFLKSGWDHVLEERKQRAVEQRTIRAEQREQSRGDAERQRLDAEKRSELERIAINEHADRQAELFMLTTKLRGCAELVAASRVISEIHQFFHRHPLYVEGSLPIRMFLERYPINLIDQAAYSPQPDDDASLLAAIKHTSYDVRIWK